jgi:hypothetical protein
MSRFVETVMTLPKGIVYKAATEGTTAHEYLTQKRAVTGLMDDADLCLIVNDNHPDGGLLYLFKDHSSVAYMPVVN